MTFEEMLIRCEEQVDSSCDADKIQLTTWDVTVTPATQDIEQDMDHQKRTRRTKKMMSRNGYVNVSS